jgi:hypothetical protein
VVEENVKVANHRQNESVMNTDTVGYDSLDDRQDSMMRFRSSSAMAPMMITTARPSGPPVSRFSRKLTNSMLR